MPTIEVRRDDLESLLGIELPKDLEELNSILAFVKGEAKLAEGPEIRIELKDSNRADIWGVEGLARALKGYLDLERGLKNYQIVDASGVDVNVDPRLKDIRPYIACSVVKNVKLTDAAIKQIMHFQDKMDQTYGRNRRRTSIGVYDFDLITPPLRYGVAKPQEISFVPLELVEKLTLEEILEKHPKGIEYGHIVRHHPVWPIFIDSEDKVLSFPPIINSIDLGRVTEQTRNVLVEVTGTTHETVLDTLTNVTLSLADREGRIHSTRIHYPYRGMGEVETPLLSTDVFQINVDYVKKVLGIKLTIREIRSLLERSRYGVVKITKTQMVVKVPCYRVDILHPIDIVEDIAIAYDYNMIQPRWPQLLTIGGLASETEFRNVIREIMIGLGYQEILSFSMTDPENLFTKMESKPEKVVEVANPKLASMTCLRNWLLPSLLEFLSNNTHLQYPQRIFEIGYCALHDEEQETKTKEPEKLAAVTIHSQASFTEAKSIMDALLANLGISFQLEPCSHGSFIEGRAGNVLVRNCRAGIIGELHPQVIQNWGLENPTAAFEVNLADLKQGAGRSIETAHP